MNNRPIAVLGGGNGGHMMAVDLTARGYIVHLYEHPNFEDSFAVTLRTGAIEAVGYKPRGMFRIHKVSIDIATVLDGVEWIHVIVPATAHDAFFARMIPHLRDGQKIVVWAGDFGSLRLRQMLRDAGHEPEIVILETNTIPYGTRLVAPGKIKLICEANRVMAAALPASKRLDVVGQLRTMFPCIVDGPHVLAAAFSNPNPMVHPPGSLLNTGRIQYSGGEFYMYREGITEAVARVIREVFAESQRVAEALEFDMLHYEERDFRTTASIFHVDFDAPFDIIGAIQTFKGPECIDSRYITEDLPFGLVPRSELGKVVAVATPVIDGFVSIGSIVCREDFWHTGRTLASLGLDELSKEEIIARVKG